jgi:hypothetical protein
MSRYLAYDGLNRCTGDNGRIFDCNGADAARRRLARPRSEGLIASS